MEPKVWMKEALRVLLFQCNTVRIFSLILLYLLISREVFSTNVPLSPLAAEQGYAIPVENGDYQVTLIFRRTSEMTQGNISVNAEGQQIIGNLASYIFPANTHSFSVVHTVSVADGVLNIQYSSPVAKVSVLLKKANASSTPTDNNLPTVSLIQPADASYLAGDDITLVAKVSDSDGKVTKASFWVDGQKINEQNVSTSSGYVTYDWKSVPAGQYQVQVQVTDDDGALAASSQVTYEVGGSDSPAPSPEDPSETPDSPVAEAGEPGLYYRYYIGNWDMLPDFSQLQPVSQGVVPNFTYDPAEKLYTMGFEFEGYLLVEQSGSYTFHVNANDGSRLYIDGQEVVNNDGKKEEAQEKSGSISLTAGYHPIRLTFFEQWGDQLLEVRYEGPGVKLQPVPDHVLFLNAPENILAAENELIYVNLHQEEQYAAAGWNNLQSAPIAGKQWTLQNTKNENTNITLRLETAWDDANNKGYSSENNDGKYPNAVTQSYYWTKGSEVLGLSGLSPNKLYSFTFYASSMYGGDRTTVYRIGDQEVSLNASYNEHKTVTIENVRPGVDGRISIEVSRAAGSSYGFLGGLVIESKALEAPSVKQNVVEQEDIVLAAEPKTEVAEKIKMKVYPNPTIGKISIETGGEASYWVSDLQGNTFSSGDISSEGIITLDLSSLPRGIYLVKTQTVSEWSTQKVIIQ